jgi:hypothetical protein
MLMLPNGNSLAFGDIVALAGDLYGLPDAPISDAAGTAKAAFNNSALTLMYAADAVDNQDPGIKKPSVAKFQSKVILAGPEATVEAALAAAAAAGKIPSTAYATDSVSGLDKRWNVISGGGSFATGWYPFGRYLKLAETNWDHFAYAGRAWKAYSAGHSIALDIAADTKWKSSSSSSSSSGVGGGNNTMNERLTLAYAFEVPYYSLSSPPLRLPSPNLLRLRFRGILPSLPHGHVFVRPHADAQEDLPAGVQPGRRWELP